VPRKIWQPCSQVEAERIFLFLFAWKKFTCLLDCFSLLGKIFVVYRELFEQENIYIQWNVNKIE
jgi:hypothetical protein